MSGSDVVAILCGVVALVATAALAVVCVRLQRVTAELVELVSDVAERSERVIAAAEQASVETAHEVARLDALIHTADGVTDRADAALRVLTNPVIKSAAAAAGTRGAARRLRSRRSDGGN